MEELEGLREGRLIPRAVLDVVLILFGAALYGFGLDAFEIPYGISAGGLAGVALVVQALAVRVGFVPPIGVMVLAMNALLLVLVVRQGGFHRGWRVFLGIVASSLSVDLLDPFVNAAGGGDLLLCAVWGGVFVGVGLGLCFRAGGNTGGTDIIAQWLSRRTAMSVGTSTLILDIVIIGASAPVFGPRAALYAAIALYVSTRVTDFVFEGPRTERAAWIISNEREAIAHDVMHVMERGCTEIAARGLWSGDDRPMLFVILNRREVATLKKIVAASDPDAIVMIADVHEAFGEGFHSMSDRAA